MSRRAISAHRVLGPVPSGSTHLVVSDGTIESVGGPDRAGDLSVTSHAGATIVPWFVDSHLHPLGYAALMYGTSLMESESIDHLIDRLAQAAASTPSAGAVMAQRFDDTRLGRMPTRIDLDRAVPDRPALIYRYCGHVAVANTAALELAGIDAATPDPAGGTIDRDGDSVPTGVLRETAAESVGDGIGHLVPPPTDEQAVAAIDGLRSLGLGRVTGIVAAGEPLWCGVGAELEGLCRIASQLTVAVDVLVIADDPDELADAARAVEAAGGNLTFLGWKSFADGSFGGHTAAMHEPYLDVRSRGTLRMDPDHAEAMARTALDLGGMSAIHAIGDRAVDTVLDVYDRLLEDGYDADHLRVEHASAASDEAIRRMAATGVIASVQPAFVASESSWVPHRLGPDRPAYRFATMSSQGVRMIGGSDCPVERPDPLWGVAAAVGRPGWEDGEQVDAATAVDLFSTAPSRLLGLSPPLAAGSPADFLVVEGTVGTVGARLVAAYHRGRPVPIHDVTWPG